MAEEKRSLIYELLVEARGADKVKDEMEGVSKSLTSVASVAKNALGILGAGFALKGIADAVDDLTRFRLSMETLGLSAEDTTATLQSVQSTAFVTGKSIAEVNKVYVEAIQLNDALKRSHADAARSAEAFVKIANAEGRSLQSAAAQINTLTFALESGTLNAKQFNTMLKESPTFARAAQEALGLTTQQLVELAKEGKLTLEQLTSILLKTEELGEKTGTVTTLDAITTGLKTLTITLLQTITSASGFNAALGEEAVSNLQGFISRVQGLGEIIGGTIRFVSNFFQEMISVIRVWAQLIADPLDWREIFGRYNADVAQDLKDMEDSIWGIHSGLEKITGNDPKLDPANIAAAKVEQAKRDQTAKDIQRQRDIDKAFKERRDAEQKRKLKEVEDYNKQLEREAEEATRKAIRLAEEFERARLQAHLDGDKDLKKAVEKTENDIDDYLDDLAERGIAEYLDKNKEVIGGISTPILDSFEQIGDAVAVLEDAFTGMFTGAIHNARDFFAQVARGLANIFAQLASAQLAGASKMLLEGLLAGFKGGGDAGLANALAQGPVHAARGAAFAGGHVIPFGTGGVVTGPTPFNLARGAGVMGEAGPEAVMPLKRMSDGKLGVSGGMPNIQIINKTGVNAKGHVEKSGDRMAIVLEAAQLGARIAEDRLNRSFRSGYGSAAQSVQSVYGLRRKV